MPVLIEIGLSRKVARNFASDGASINIRAELDQAVLGRPEDLQQQVAALYRRAQEALDKQMLPLEESPDRAPEIPAPSPPARHHPRSERGATPSQLRALRSMAQRIDVAIDDIARAEMGRPIEQLSLREASQLIDLLKSRQARPHSGFAGAGA